MDLEMVAVSTIQQVCVYCLTTIEIGEPIVSVQRVDGAYHEDCYYAGDVAD